MIGWGNAEIPLMGKYYKVAFPCLYDAFLLHLSKFLGQGAALKIQVISKLLTVKGNIEFLGPFLK